MTNPNDPTAKYYETASQFLKNEIVLTQELELIKTNTKKHSRILDIGCGTGRHLIPLLESGHELEGIDASTGMLRELLQKKPEAKVICGNIFEQQLPSVYFDLILMFWNTFNEIALTRPQAKKLLQLCHQALAKHGKLIINIDDSATLDPEHLDFKFTVMGEPSYQYKWKVKSFQPRTNTTISKESIIFPEQVISTEIAQRWWSRTELEKFARENGFRCKLETISSNSELYLVLTKNGESDQ